MQVRLGQAVTRVKVTDHMHGTTKGVGTMGWKKIKTENQKYILGHVLRGWV